MTAHQVKTRMKYDPRPGDVVWYVHRRAPHWLRVKPRDFFPPAFYADAIDDVVPVVLEARGVFYPHLLPAATWRNIFRKWYRDECEITEFGMFPEEQL